MHNSNNFALSKDTIFGAKNHTNINSVFNSASSLEDFSVAKAKEAVQVFTNLERLREAVKIFNERKAKEQLPANITEAPKFHEVLDDQIENVRKQVQESFARQQVARAKKYNVPYSFYTVDIYELSKEIDHYEFLLGEAKDLGIYWDISEYDPVALEQEIETYRESEIRSNNLMYSDYFYSRRVAL